MGDSVIKGLPLNSDHFGQEPFMEEGVHWRHDDEAISLLSGCFEFFIGSKVYSSVPLHYALAYNREEGLQFMRSLRAHEPIFVGGDGNEEELVSLVLGASEFLRVPQRSAYGRIDEIYPQLVDAIARKSNEANSLPCTAGEGKLGSERNKSGHLTVIVLSCGSLSKIISKRLHQEKSLGDLYIFDLGSVIDVFAGRDGWTWVRKAGIDARAIQEMMDALSLKNE